jgi:mono/diheme cytochrome c family protein
MRCIIPVIIILVLLFTLLGCASSPSTTPAPPSSQTGQQSTTATSGSQTFGALAAAGQAVYARSCSKCHGANGEGAAAQAVLNTNAQLGKYKTAQGLLDFVDTSMPFNAPGSLSRQDYLSVTAYMLVQTGEVTADTPFNENQLGTIALK